MQNKIDYLNKYKNRFSFMPLAGKSKVAVEKGWQRYSYEKSDFPINQLVDANVGVVTGPASGIIVVDVDYPLLFQSFLRRNGHALPDDFKVRTGKGCHAYLKYPDDGNAYGCKEFSVFGFDIRGAGGYVVAPYSIHEETGNIYELLSEGGIPDAPNWLLDMILKGKGGGAPDYRRIIKNNKTIGLIETGTPEGERSESIMIVLNSLVYSRFNDDQIFFIFNTKPIGEKYLEKPENIRDQWLQDQIDKAREHVDVSSDNIGTARVELPTISLVSTSELEAKNISIQWLVEDLIEVGGHTLITGRSGLGKSLFTLNIAYKLASGSVAGLLGNNIIRPQKVALIQCENSEAFMKDRIQKLCSLNPEFEKHKDNVQLVYFDDRHDNPIFKLSNRNLNEYISQMYENFNFDVLIIDPYKSYSGANENDNDQNREVLDRFFYALGKYGITAIVVHHEGKANEFEGTARSRGASAITDCFSNHWTIRRQKEKDTGIEHVVVGCAKARNYPKYDDIHLEPVNGIYFKMIDDPFDPIKLIDILFQNEGSFETQGKLLKHITYAMQVSAMKAREMIKDAVTKGYIIEEPHGKNVKRYILPVDSNVA